MKIVVAGPGSSFSELTEGSVNIEWIRAPDVEKFSNYNNADAFFNLNEDADKSVYPDVTVPIFINSTINTISDTDKNKKIVRINGWNGFLKRDVWEIAGNIDEKVTGILSSIGKRAVTVSDEPGFISARIIAMIVNEAYFAKGENVSSEKEIDIAMKLGTNYPKGPFEWSKEIGLQNICDLLIVLAKTDSRYQPAPLLKKECAAK